MVCASVLNNSAKPVRFFFPEDHKTFTPVDENTGRHHTCETSAGFFEDEEQLKGRHILLEHYEAKKEKNYSIQIHMKIRNHIRKNGSKQSMKVHLKKNQV